MASLRLVVGDKAVFTATDTYVQGLLQGLGHTVTALSDEDAEDITGMAGVVICESCVTATLGAKYALVAVPVVTHEPQILDDMLLVDAANVSSVTDTLVQILDGTHPITNGPYGTYAIGTLTILSSASNISFTQAGMAAGVTKLASTSGGVQVEALACDKGGALTSGTAADKRAFVWPHNNSGSLVNTDGQAIIKNAYAWAFQASTGLAWMRG